MMSWPMAFLLPLVVSSLVPVDPAAQWDDYLAVSCPRSDACLLLDGAGNLFFSEDAGRTRHLRAHLGDLGLVRIRFAGLLKGWAMDRSGRLWSTRDGGRRFSPLTLAQGERASCLALDPTGQPWVGARSGRVYRPGPGGRYSLAVEGPAEPVVALAIDRDLVAVAYGSGTLITRPLRSGAGPVLTTRPLKLRSGGVVAGPGGRLVAAGCRGAVRWSADRGRTWAGPPAPVQERPCLTPLAWLPGNGQAVLAGQSGLVLVDMERGKTAALASAVELRLRDAAWAGPRLVLVGDGGSIASLARRLDGGWTLERITTPRPAVSGLHLSGRRTVVRAMSDGSLAASMDGGQSWRPLGSPGSELSRVVFTDALNGYALVGEHSVAGTRDGGKTWETLGTWNELSLNDLAFVDSDTGWAVGEAGVIVRTTDGGRNWALDRVPAFDGALSRLQFVDRKHGYAVGAKQAVFRTKDGGSVWHRVHSGSGRLGCLFFVDKSRGFVAGDRGEVLFTRDGGQSWERRNLPADAAAVAIAFSDPTRGLVASPGGRLWATQDGGRSWRPVNLRSRAEIRALACLPKSRQCLLGGDGGMLLLGDPYSDLIQ